MEELTVEIKLLKEEDKEQFIRDNQEAFNYGALQEFGMRDSHFEEGGQIISRKTIEEAIASGTAFRIYVDNEKVGGAVVKTKDNRGFLELLFISPNSHSKGIGQAAWMKIEDSYPDITVWETCTPYFEKRNIHFYVNRLGFHIVEFFNAFHPDPNEPELDKDEEPMDGMFRFEKVIR